MKKRIFLWAAAIFAAAFSILTAAINLPLIPASYDGGKDFQISAFGPGVENLSAGDSYAVYQWALQNDGQFQLVELVNRFQEIDPFYAAVIEHARQEGIRSPAVGPGNYSALKTTAIAGIDINIRKAWEIYDADEREKRSVVVAIIDTGVDINHPELEGAIWMNEGEIPDDGIDNTGNGYIDDYHGWNFYDNNNQVYTGGEDDHGTHAAGTIAAARSSGGIAGIADNRYVKIMSLKALGSSEGVGDAQSIIAAIRYAEANGAAICNLSFGTLTDYPELEEVMRSSRMLFVVAAGNGDDYGNGYDIDDSPVYPASYQLDNVITVASLLFDGTLAVSSNYGAASVDLAAPGAYILSCTTENSFGFMSGTSMAAPMVTGVAAMLYSYRTEISLPEVKTILMNSSKQLDSLSGKTVSGGMPDACAALTYGN